MASARLYPASCSGYMVPGTCSAAARAWSAVVSCRHPACRSMLGYQLPVPYSVR
jgi:hypothetical protein